MLLIIGSFKINFDIKDVNNLEKFIEFFEASSKLDITNSISVEIKQPYIVFYVKSDDFNIELSLDYTKYISELYVSLYSIYNLVKLSEINSECTISEEINNKIIIFYNIYEQDIKFCLSKEDLSEFRGWLEKPTQYFKYKCFEGFELEINGDFIQYKTSSTRGNIKKKFFINKVKESIDNYLKSF